MPNTLRNLHEKVVDEENGLIFDKNLDIPVEGTDLPLRCNVYRPLDTEQSARYPVLVTYGPYGKDIYYGE